MDFALNHMSVRRLGTEAFLALAADLGCGGVELRNDLGRPLFDGAEPGTVRAMAAARGLRLLALAELKGFNDWSEDRAREARALMATARAAGAEAVALIPRNDGRGLGNGERQANLRLALRELAPMLEEFGLIGLVEPLGFERSSLRHKAEAVEAIEALGLAGRVRLVHDSFHHHLAGGGPVFAEHTGIVHVSGVTDPALATAEMRDEHRVLVDARDRLGTIEQLEALMDGGWRGPVSIEAFAPEVHELDNPGAALAASFAFIRSALEARVA